MPDMEPLSDIGAIDQLYLRYFASYFEALSGLTFPFSLESSSVAHFDRFHPCILVDPMIQSSSIDHTCSWSTFFPGNGHDLFSGSHYSERSPIAHDELAIPHATTD